MDNFFVRRPIVAMVIAIIIVIHQDGNYTEQYEQQPRHYSNNVWANKGKYHFTYNHCKRGQ